TVRLEAMLASLGDEPIGIAAITASELLHGALRGGDAGVRVRRAAFAEAVVDLVPVLPFGVPEARRHAQLWAELVASGAVIGPHALLVSATALARGWGVVTMSEREFGRVAGLRVVSVAAFLV
ncbi:MAG TPA: PIN domain-containing protein, partial [Gemmatimonadaceae bacterium]|nr:PIN domain-containing protein [Gemmatimonadaceae bacterium]